MTEAGGDVSGRSVRGRHSAGVILLGGWLLLVPRENVPMSKWEQKAAFDTARACEEWEEEDVDLRFMEANENFAAWIDTPEVDTPEGRARREVRENNYQRSQERQDVASSMRCLSSNVVFAPTPSPTHRLVVAVVISAADRAA